MSKHKVITPQREVRVNKTPQKFTIRKNGDGTRSVSGYFAKFNSLSSDLGGFFERISPGAFTDSLRSSPDVLCFYNHNSDAILGRVSSGTLSVSEDTVGLRFDVKLPDTSYAKDLVSLMQRSDVTGCSFGFSVADGGDSWEQVGDQIVRTLNKVTLWEGSIVGQPAYPETVADLRSCPMPLRSRLRPSVRRNTVTKEVDGEHLTADDFLIVGDPSKTDTWHLPWHFSTEEKTKLHLRDALSRFDQVQGVSKTVLHDAWVKLFDFCKQYGIAVSVKAEPRAAKLYQAGDYKKPGFLRSMSDDDDDDDGCSSDSSSPNYDPDCDDEEDSSRQGSEDGEPCECACRSCDLGFCDMCLDEDCYDTDCRSCPNQGLQEDDPSARSYFNRLLTLIVSGK